MTIAELHGKLSPDAPDACHERMEDLLTSDVFGTLRYAGWAVGFGAWLRSATPAPLAGLAHRPLATAVIEAPRRVALAFWPTLPNGREADVAVLVENIEGSAALFLVEAKYLSGTSDTAPSADAARGRSGNQVADQVNGLATLDALTIATWFALDALPRVTTRIHLLITTHTTMPTDVYRVAALHVRPEVDVHACWLSWTSLARHLGPHRYGADEGKATLVEDLVRLLERKGLVPYSGFTMGPWLSRDWRGSFWRDGWWRLDSRRWRTIPRFWTDRFWTMAPWPEQIHPRLWTEQSQ